MRVNDPTMVTISTVCVLKGQVTQSLFILNFDVLLLTF